MFTEDVKRRFQRARIFQGRLAELLFAAWRRIESMEARGGVADVVATGPAGQSFSFEVKHLVQDEVLFDLGVAALSGNGASFGHPPVYSPVAIALSWLYFRSIRSLMKFL
jgi:hypothetical protein